MEEPPKKPHRLSDEQTEEILKFALGKDIKREASHADTGTGAAEEQLGKGPEERSNRLKEAKNIDKLLAKLFEKEIIVSTADKQLTERIKKLEKKLEIMRAMYETKSRLFNGRLDRLMKSEDEARALKELIEASEYSEKYLETNDPERTKGEIEKLKKKRIKNEEKLLKVKKQIENLNEGLDLHSIGMANLWKKVKELMDEDADLLARDTIILLQ